MPGNQELSGKEPISRALEQLLHRAGEVTSGVLADYIPELALVDPGAFGISLVSVLGHDYRAGDSGVRFTIQSISKAFVYALALNDLGLEAVHRCVGLEPSGEPFNAISLDDAGRPENPMINAGAIVTTALVSGSSAEERYERIRVALSGFAGRDLQLDQQVYASESLTGNRNRALAYLTRAAGSLVCEPEDATDAYFKQCALLVDASDLAVMASTLANGGINPITGERVVEAWVSRHTLSLMMSCGMYDRAGAWAFRVGMPAKSGVGGGIVAVKPGQFGIGVFSPRLDEAGNSSRGVAALTMLSEEYGLHLFNHPSVPGSPIDLIATDLDGTLQVRVRGEIDFVEVEQIVYDVQLHLFDRPERLASVVLDLSDVTDITDVARTVFLATVATAEANGRSVEFIDPSGLLL